MLQQTRVETVRAYYTSWHTRWPTIEDLAKAEEAEVLNSWKGLGYYSRATRIHKAAKLIVDDDEMKGMLPEFPSELEAKVPGVGRYTAGAISSIVFGHAAPILDGNVMRVLCRQLGLFANMKSKITTDLLWEVAERLVKRVTKEALVEKGVEMEEEEVPKSEIPSFWNQALMELGSTLCRPIKPDCWSCPVKETCLAYAEGEKLAAEKGWLDAESSSSVFDTTSKVEIPDIEDLCSYCEPIEETEIMDEPEPTSKPATKGKAKPQSKSGLKQGTLAFGQKSKPVSEAKEPKDDHAAQAKDLIEKHVSLFPLKVIKKAVRNEEHIVCLITRDLEKKEGGQDEPEWLIEQRPNKGLLANLWQFPSYTIYSTEGKPDDSDEQIHYDEDDLPTKLKRKTKSTTTITKEKKAPKSSTEPQHPPTSKQRENLALRFGNTVTEDIYPKSTMDYDRDRGCHHHFEVGSITHLFSHIKLVMHVHSFSMGGQLTGKEPKLEKGFTLADVQSRKWVTAKQMEEENIGTGMRKCWALKGKAEDMLEELGSYHGY